jgi:hypothetical protein
MSGSDINMFFDVRNFDVNGSTINGIICLTSSNEGISWKIKEKIYGIEDETCVCYKHPFLFTMDKNKGEVFVSNINNGYKYYVTKSSSIKSTASIDNHGTIYFYYYTKSGFPSGVFSKNSGITWEKLTNW